MIKAPFNDNILVLEAGKSYGAYWKDVWRFRDLFYFLALRDILVRYKQTVLGLMWSVLRPALTVSVFVLVFDKIAKMDSGDVPYPIMVLVAILPWQLFSSSVQESSNSLIINANMISKIYFPRVLIPASTIFVGIIDFLISFFILILMLIWYDFRPSINLILLPLFFINLIVLSMGIGLWFSALNVKYRDIRFVVPFVIQFGLYISPIGFSSANIPDKWRLLYSINPIVGVIDGFRWCFFAEKMSLFLPGIIISTCSSIVLFFIGLKYFRETERYFADII